jgi:hypothetical protein
MVWVQVGLLLPHSAYIGYLPFADTSSKPTKQTKRWTTRIQLILFGDGENKQKGSGRKKENL